MLRFWPRLTSNSPARFASDTGGDLGALPYTSDATPGLHGTLWSNITLTAAGSPYAVAGDLTVAPGVSLTIEPGVTLAFATTDLMGAGEDPARSELRVSGALQASGTASSPIVFESTGTATNLWTGIVVTREATAATLSHVVIQERTGPWRAGPFGACSRSPARPSPTRSTACTSSLATRPWTPSTSRGPLSGSRRGITPRSPCGRRPSATAPGIQLSPRSGSQTFTVTNAVVASSAIGVVMSPRDGGRATLLLTNSTLHASGSYALIVVPDPISTAHATVTNSIITQGQFGISRFATGTSSVAVTYSNVWGNTSADYTNVSPGAGCISADPLFVAAPTDLHLQGSSASIDVGTATSSGVMPAHLLLLVVGFATRFRRRGTSASP